MAIHVSDVFGVPVSLLFDAAHRMDTPFELPLWTGLRLQALAVMRADELNLRDKVRTGVASGVPLRDVEVTMIRKAVADARGNVMEAAKALGISRATVYRKLGKRS
jgi:DNA-binding NtrC family response regulator